jgi:hypothetical protein
MSISPLAIHDVKNGGNMFAVVPRTVLGSVDAGSIPQSSKILAFGMRPVIVIAAVLTILLSVPAVAQLQDNETKAIDIPLNQIWAYKMPGTREIEKSVSLADLKRLFTVFESWYKRADRLKWKT